MRAVTPSLPAPRLSATVYPPLAKGMYGAVVVTLGGRVRDPDESQHYAVTSRRDSARGPVRCTSCGRTGHARSNRKFHP